MSLRFEVEYYDQNEEFSKLLPRTGTIIRRVKAKGDSSIWSIIKLDEPFQYCAYSPEKIPLNTFNCSHFLIRSRWPEHEIGEAKPVSVFILLAFNESDYDLEEIDVQKFYQAAWGLCSCAGEVET